MAGELGFELEAGAEFGIRRLGGRVAPTNHLEAGFPAIATTYIPAIFDNLLSSISPNTFTTFRPGVAKQLISVNKDGYLIVDGILFWNEDAPAGLVLIGHRILIDWVRFNVEKAAAAGKDVHHRLEPNSHMRQGPPTFCCYELQGPKADEVMTKVFGGPPPEIKFSTSAMSRSPAARSRHCATVWPASPGFEFYGPWEDNEIVLDALMEAGAEFDIRPSGREGVLVVPSRVGLGPPIPCRLRRRLRRLPRVAARGADRLGRRLAVPRRHPRLLHDPARPWPRPLGAIRP